MPPVILSCQCELGAIVKYFHKRLRTLGDLLDIGGVRGWGGAVFNLSLRQLRGIDKSCGMGLW